MNRKHIAGALVAGVVAAFALAPGALGSSCPERGGHTCQYGGDASGRAKGSNPQKPKPQVKPAYGRNGEQVWRAGDHIMY